MAENTLDQVERLVDQLTPREQARLLAFLALRMAQVVKRGTPGSVAVTEGADAWAELFRVGDTLAAEDKPEFETLTSAVSAMRR
jgi:hypothetical protein